MKSLRSIKIKFQIYLMAVLLVVIAVFNIGATTIIDNCMATSTAQHSTPAVDDHRDEITKIKRYVFVVSLLLFLLTTPVLWFVIHRVIHPVKKIKKGLEMVSRGDYSYRINLDSNDEFTFLADRFNQMGEQLESMMSEVETTQKDLEHQVKDRTRALNETNDRLKQAMDELKVTQKRIILSETQKSLTAIVAGFGHEINNPLTGILGAIDLVELKNDIPPYFKKKLTHIKRQAFRIKGVIDELNRLNPGIDPTKLEIDLGNLLEKLVKICNRKKNCKDIKFITRFPNEVVRIHGNHSALWQVFEGVVENAVEAIGERESKDGEIRVGLETSPDGAFAVTKIIDNGGGFENIDKAFDPFYTTKSRTIKKGIGLSIAYNLIREHSGNILIANTGSGAALEIHLPCLQKTILEKKPISI